MLTLFALALAVQVVDKDPQGCVFVKDFEGKADRWTQQELKAQTAKLGGDTLLVSGAVAKAFKCAGAAPNAVTARSAPAAGAPAIPQLSAELRRDKRFRVTGEIGTAVAPVLTGGVTLGWFRGPDQLLELNVAAGSEDEDDGAYGSAKRDETEASLVVIRWKRIWNNSFHTNLGTGERSMKGTRHFSTYEFSGVNKETTYEIDDSRLVFDVSIGNGWQYDAFTIGVDWIGISVPLAQLKRDETYSDPAIKTKSNTKIEELRKDTKTVTAQALRLSLGASF